MDLYLFAMCGVLIPLSLGYPAPLNFALTEDKHNVTVNLQLGIPKHYLNGKVKLEFQFGQQCSQRPTESDVKENLNIIDQVTTYDPIYPTDPPQQSSLIYQDCNDIPYEYPGLYNITIEDSIVTVDCEVLPDRRKFLIFQRRQDGSVDFYRDWSDYAQGFGEAAGEFWLGNLNLHHLTSSADYTLRVELQSFNDTFAYAEYEHFAVGPPSYHFPLTVSGYSGTAGDSLSLHSGALFSTEDVDNDFNRNENCAKLYKGGWWYTSCFYTNLNGLYHTQDFGSGKGINWFYFMGYHNSMKSVKMMLTRK